MGTMVMTNSGHTALARAVMAQDLWLAWGDLPAFLPAPSGLSASQVAGSGTLAAGNVAYVMTASNANGETIASAELDVTVAAANSEVTVSSSSVAGATLYSLYGRTPGGPYDLVTTGTTPTLVDTGATLTVQVPPTVNGTSQTPWTTTVPASPTTVAQLYEELCRRKALIKTYVKPDANGAYTTTTGKWSPSLMPDGVTPLPSRYIYTYVGFDLTDVPTATLYQYAFFLGTTPVAGQQNATFLVPAQVADPGTLLCIENIQPVIRNTTTRQVIETVLTF